MALLQQTQPPRPLHAGASSVAADTFEFVEAPSSREVPSIALVLAAGAWLWLTAWVSRLLVPLFGHSLLDDSLSVVDLLVQGHAFALVALGTLLTIGLTRPRAEADEPVRARPFLAATIGGLAAWAFAQGFWFEPVSATALGVLAASHTVEAVMLGSMIGSLARKPVVAMVLGATFQFAVLGLATLALFLAG